MANRVWTENELTLIQLKWGEIASLRDQLLKNQNSCCLICDQKINKQEAVLDHHHCRRVGGTGQIRGVLCRTCNVFLGKIENNCKRYRIPNENLPVVLANIIKYLSSCQFPYIHPSEKAKPLRLQKSSYNELKKIMNGKKKIPPYPKSGTLTKGLEQLFYKHGIVPKYYS